MKRTRMEWPPGVSTDFQVRVSVPQTGEIYEGPAKAVMPKVVTSLALGLRVLIYPLVGDD